MKRIAGTEIASIYIYENGTLKLITDAVYENGKLLNFKQAFPDTTTGGKRFGLSRKEPHRMTSAPGGPWHYFRNGNYDQNFQFDSVTAKDMISADDLRSVVGTDIEGYYCGVNSDGHFNDNTGNAYMGQILSRRTCQDSLCGSFCKRTI